MGCGLRKDGGVVSSHLERIGIRSSEGGARAGRVNGSSQGISLRGVRDTC